MLKRTFLGAAAAALASPYSVLAQSDYPSQVIKLVVTYPPGGASDLMARIFGEKLAEVMGQTVVVENKPGAGGAIGTDFAARQAADGHSFMIGNMGPTIVLPLLSKVPYDMAKDFTPVSLIATAPAVLVVNGKSPYRTLAELVAGAKAKPLNFGSGGNGTLAHLIGEMMNRSAGINMQHVPYKGGIQALGDVIGNQLDMLAADVQPIMQHLRSGTLRALAVTSPKRFAQLPDVPTFVESGMTDLDALNSWGVFVPTGVPKARLDKFSDAVRKVMADGALSKRFTELGIDPLHTSADELRRFMAADTAKFARIIKENKITTG
jgi:tripartite-type tricarboxylate transporter receptor subunit TctC